MDDFESPFYPVHGRDPLEGRLSNLQNYCTYIADQPRWIAVQELRKLYTKLLAENRVTMPIDNQKVTKTSDLKIGQLVFVKDHHKGTFNPTYTFDHIISAIVKESKVIHTTPGGRERGCNIHQIKQCQHWSHQQVLSNSFSILCERIQSAQSQVTITICMQEIINYSTAPYL